MMEINLIDDLSKFSGIPQSKLNNLVTKSSMDIAQSVEEYLTSTEDYCNINIGIGNLYIQEEDGQLFFKFIPSNQLTNMVNRVVDGKKSDLVITIEDVLTEKMLKLYKELF